MGGLFGENNEWLENTEWNIRLDYLSQFFFLSFFFFDVDHFFKKVFIECVTILLLFLCFVFLAMRHVGS